MVDMEVAKARNIKHVIASPVVRIDDAVGHDLALYDRHQRDRGRVWNDLRINLLAAFSDPNTGILSRCTSPAFTSYAAAEVTLVHLDFDTKHGLTLGFQLIGDYLA